MNSMDGFLYDYCLIKINVNNLSIKGFYNLKI